MGRSKVVFLALALAVWAILASSVAVYYYVRYSEASTHLQALEEATVKVGVVIDYGNGTVEEFEGLILDVEGATALNALLLVARVEYKVYPFGVFVESINGVKNSKELNMWWLYYVRQPGGEEKMPEVGADQYKLKTGETVIWRYSKL